MGGGYTVEEYEALQAEKNALQTQLTQKDKELQQKTNELNAMQSILSGSMNAVYIMRIEIPSKNYVGNSTYQINTKYRFDNNEFTVLNNNTDHVTIQANKNMQLTIANVSDDTGQRSETSGYLQLKKKSLNGNLEGLKKFYTGYTLSYSKQGVGPITENLYSKALISTELKAGEALDLSDSYSYNTYAKFELLFGIKTL